MQGEQEVVDGKSPYGQNAACKGTERKRTFESDSIWICKDVNDLAKQ